MEIKKKIWYFFPLRYGSVFWATQIEVDMSTFTLLSRDLTHIIMICTCSFFIFLFFFHILAWTKTLSGWLLLIIFLCFRGYFLCIYLLYSPFFQNCSLFIKTLWYGLHTHDIYDFFKIFFYFCYNIFIRQLMIFSFSLKKKKKN